MERSCPTIPLLVKYPKNGSPSKKIAEFQSILFWNGSFQMIFLTFPTGETKMKRFKLIFHVSYVIIALSILYFSIDVLANTNEYLSKIKLSQYIEFPRYVMIAFLAISVIMLIEFILERFNVYRVKEGIEEMEHEIVRLKAKLYDQTEEGEESEESEEEEEEEEELEEEEKEEED